MSWKPEVKTDGDPKWYANSLVFGTRQEAADNARDLSHRWLRVVEHRAAESKDPINYTYLDGQLKPVEKAAV